jgi:hypothetical protein
VMTTREAREKVSKSTNSEVMTTREKVSKSTNSEALRRALTHNSRTAGYDRGKCFWHAPQQQGRLRNECGALDFKSKSCRKEARDIQKGSRMCSSHYALHTRWNIHTCKARYVDGTHAVELDTYFAHMCIHFMNAPIHNVALRYSLLR